MHVRSVASALLGLMLLGAAALAQTHPLREPESSGGAAEPDQPVQPQTPVLAPRAPQQPGPQPPPAPFTLTPDEQAQVDRVLSQWEQRNRDIQTFDCRFERWTYDVVFGQPNRPKFIDRGVMRYAAPDRGLLRVELTEKDGKWAPIDDARTEHWISDGRSIFEMNPAKKQLIEHKLPQELQGKAIADGPLPFLFGAEAQKLKQRYWIHLVSPPPGVKGQIWLEAFPRYQQDAANFSRAEFIIAAEGMSPYGLNLIQPNKKDRIAYQFYDIVINDPLRLFKGDPFRPFTPFGWQKIVEPAQGAQARRTPDDRR